MAGRHKAARIGHQHNQGILAHKRRFTAHIGAGDDVHAQPIIKV